MANDNDKIEKKVEEECERKDKRKRKRMHVSGKSVFELQRLMNTPKKRKK